MYLIISTFVLILYGRPIIYKGKRLGLNKKIFYMYKFRTLPTGLDKKLGSELFSRTSIKIPFFAKFLRETRLDELPQLFNILKRDMDFLGPRPLRPEIYEKWKGQIPN
jgi:lipopolysaccharide/colanic/teichoic acid biosynthesis glycosyltransferase